MLLVSMTEDDLQQWLKQFIPSYAQGHIQTGRWSTENGITFAREEVNQAIPDGLYTKNHYFFSLVTEPQKQKVGMLWFEVRARKSGRRVAYVFNIEIDPPFRRQGYASAALTALEQQADELGFDEIALHVWGHNHNARALYEKLGYQPTDITMAKLLRAPHIP